MARRKYLKPWTFGVVAGTLVVLAEAFAGLYPPAAYAFCLTCHTRDLVGTVLGGLIPGPFQTTMLARRVLMVTSPCVLLGGYLAARRFGEFKVQRSTRPLFFALFGFVVMTVGILIFGCPTRIAVRTGYGDLYGIAALAAMVAGIWASTLIMRRIWRGRASR
jgi:hypothetical protein